MRDHACGVGYHERREARRDAVELSDRADQVKVREL
jgi:hypothetical protein